tara:strand:- start:1467 stop:2222 length:756 start_codon:yes stop_codon:yes gene_type:complete
MEFKELYSFSLEEEREVEKTHTRKNKKTGEETTVTKKVKAKVPVQVRLKRPSRRELEEAELEYSIEMSRCVKKGILTKAMLFKKYSDTGGAFTEAENKDYYKIYKQVFESQNEYIRLESSENKTKEDEKRIEELKEEIIEGKKKMVDAESSMQTIFDHTADVKAQNRLLLWYTLMLTNTQEEGEDEPTPYFKGIDFDDKLEDYYSKEEEASDFYGKLVQKVTTILAFWFYNQASTPDEFSDLLEKVEKGEI